MTDERDQHDSAFKGIMELILSRNCVRSIAGSEVAKFPLRVDFITQRVCPLHQDMGVVAWLINQLPPFVVYEFKGPTDPLSESHIWRLIGYCGLFAMEKQLSFFEQGIAAMVVYVGASDTLRHLITSHTETMAPGISRYPLSPEAVGGLQVYFVDVNGLALTPENLPFLLFREADIEQVLDMILTSPETKRLYGYTLYKIRRKTIQRLLRKKGITMTEVATLKELIEDFGVKAVIDEVGVKAVIDEVGVKAVIDEVGVKAVIDEVGVKAVIDEVGVKAVIDEVGLDILLREAGLKQTLQYIQNLIDAKQLTRDEKQQLLEIVDAIREKIGK
ncbi:MAG: hypothetical protein K9W43_04825 [Candidatus Thorarchaeota archaeon]|nr:hypothetical protein [Candidatus Thorarchaeota archaeon]